jgi:hypothetical protein
VLEGFAMIAKIAFVICLKDICGFALVVMDQWVCCCGEGFIFCIGCKIIIIKMIKKKKKIIDSLILI